MHQNSVACQYNLFQMSSSRINFESFSFLEFYLSMKFFASETTHYTSAQNLSSYFPPFYLLFTQLIDVRNVYVNKLNLCILSLTRIQHVLYT